MGVLILIPLNLRTNLDIFGISPEEVTHVILSHLHYDHAAGSTYIDAGTTTKATLPNAHYFVQKLSGYMPLNQLHLNPAYHI